MKSDFCILGSGRRPWPTDDANYHCCSPQADSHIAKKRRISYSNSPGKAVATPKSVVSRLSRYPKPDKFRREVHAPCRLSRVGFLSSGVRCESSGIRAKKSIMGNALRHGYEKARINLVGAFRFMKFGKNKEVIDLDAEPLKEDGVSKDWEVVEIVEDGNEVRSVVSDEHRTVESDGLGLEITDLGRKGVQSDGIEETLPVSDLTKVEYDVKDLGLRSLGREAYEELLRRVNRKYNPNLDSLNFEIKSYEARRKSIQSLQKSKEKKKPEEPKKPEEDFLREAFVPLTEDEERDVTRALSNSNRRKILVTHKNSNIDITGEILQCLKPGSWLNDEVINLYLELLKEREKREPKKFLNCHFFSTFFYKKLIGGRNGYDFKAVRRWTTQRKLGYGLTECDKIFVPIHKEVHWCLAVINKKDKSLQYLDSLGGGDNQVLRVLARYFMDEVKDKSGQEIDVDCWKQEYVEDLPEQQNGFDCGVFMIKYADFYSRGLGLHFSQENMPYFRRRTAKEILRLRAD